MNTFQFHSKSVLLTTGLYFQTLEQRGDLRKKNFKKRKKETERDDCNDFNKLCQDVNRSSINEGNEGCHIENAMIITFAEITALGMQK